MSPIAPAIPALLLALLATADPPAVDLARAARSEGDPARGARVFYRPELACARCHEAAEGRPPLGPALDRPRDRPAADEHLVESILEPSKVIAEGYATVAVATEAGAVLTGIVADDRPEALVLRDPAQDGRLVEIPRAEVAERKTLPTSLMPAGLADLVGSRRDFLDLVAYLLAIADGGPGRARELRPDPASLAPKVAAYEADVDHAGLIAGLGPENLERGEAIYGRVCANCHGTADAPGSMPTSLKFAEGAFKNGADPHAMYRTLTLGHGQMPAQTWMVPRQKYDVIHYIREAYLRPKNPAQYAPVDAGYLASLPKGTTFGPEPSTIEPWSVMDYGPSLMAAIEVGDDGRNIARKGIAVRLDPGPGGVARGRRFVLYDHDTLQTAAAWGGPGFIDWRGINFDGRHQVHPRVVGEVAFELPAGPGWADPATGSFADPRPIGRDGKPYGHLPRPWARYRGLHHHGDRVVLAYTIGSAEILELPGSEPDPAGGEAWVLTRTLEVGPSPHPLKARVAPAGVAAALAGPGTLAEEAGCIVLRLPASDETRTLRLFASAGDRTALAGLADQAPPAGSLRTLTLGGPARFPEVLTARAVRGDDRGPFAVDTLAHPDRNPWNCRMRFTGLDFLDGGRAAVCDWDGDVWIVGGLDDPAGVLTWRRVASGLFQPLGLKVVDGRIFVGCRDQIAILDDRDGDGEADFIDCFNTDHQVTEHFHEFAMGLQVDAEGNFLYAKAARHALPAVVPHHGTLLRVSKDGSETEILATGFRAPNGVCLNPDGTFFMTDQEGHWIPKNRINLVRPGGFYGNMWGFHDVTDPADSAMEPPVFWITNAFDRSPSELVRVEGASWGPLEGALLNLSYGYGKMYVVLTETVDGRMQGGMAELPVPQFPTGIMRGRFRPADEALYACGMFAWAGTQEQPGGFYRVRPTGVPPCVPIGLHAREGALEITFTDPLDPSSAADPARYGLACWGLKRSARYGSDHVDEHAVEVAGAAVSADGRTVTLAVPGLRPTMGMAVRYDLRSAGGRPASGAIHGTIHRLGGGP